MEYRTAKSIRGRSLSSMITERIVSGGGVSSSIKRAISDKMKAKATGIKEKFDPMNIAKFLTGGSNLGPAILGRLTGRKKSDIEYFTNRGNRTATRIGKTNEIGTIGGDSLGVIKSLFVLIKKSHEEDLKLRETERTFREERVNEENRRHQEFLNALKAYTETTATVVAPEKEKGGGILDFLKNIIANTIKEVKALIDNAVAGIMKVFSWISGLRVLTSVAGWLSTLANIVMGGNLAAILGFLLPAAAVGSLLFLLSREMENIRKNPNAKEYEYNPYAMMLRGEAATLKEAGEINRRRTLKKYTKPEIIEALNTTPKLPDDVLKDAYGADRETLQNWLEANKDVPNAIFDPQKQGQLAVDDIGRRMRQSSFRQSEIREQNYSPGMNMTPMGGGSSSGSTTTPMSNMGGQVSGSNVYDRSTENINLNMAQSMGGGSAQPVVTSSVTNTSTDQPLPATAGSRDDTDILKRIFGQSMARF